MASPSFFANGSPLFLPDDNVSRSPAQRAHTAVHPPQNHIRSTHEHNGSANTGTGSTYDPAAGGLQHLQAYCINPSNSSNHSGQINSHGKGSNNMSSNSGMSGSQGSSMFWLSQDQSRYLQQYTPHGTSSHYQSTPLGTTGHYQSTPEGAGNNSAPHGTSKRRSGGVDWGYDSSPGMDISAKGGGEVLHNSHGNLLQDSQSGRKALYHYKSPNSVRNVRSSVLSAYEALGARGSRTADAAGAPNRGQSGSRYVCTTS